MMSRIFQILADNLDDKTLLRFYLRSGQRYDDVLHVVLARLNMGCNKRPYKLYSLKNEDDIITSKLLVQVQKIKKNEYTVAVHTDLTYLLVYVSQDKQKSMAYSASIQNVITNDLLDYENIYNDVLPKLFMEFIAYSVNVFKSPDCKFLYTKKDNISLVLNGTTQCVCSYINGKCFGDINLTHDGPS
jgi:hypothetical protein